jgi:beta-glucanase (GH16 family)
LFGSVTRLRAALAATVALAAVGSAAVAGGGSASAASAAQSRPAQASLTAGMRLAFSSSFTGTKVNTKIWATCYWGASKAGCTNFGNGTKEKEWYLASQDRVSNGTLLLVAQHKATAGLDPNGKPKTYACRSGMVTTDPGFHFKYGMVQVTAQIPYNTGLWAGLWLAAANHNWPPEIDVLEHWHFDKQAKVYLHPVTGARQGGPVYTPGNLSRGWHNFRLYWTKTRLTWSIDGITVFTTTTDIPQQSMYLIATLADDQTTAGSCTGTLAIKSVKVWQQS